MWSVIESFKLGCHGVFLLWTAKSSCLIPLYSFVKRLQLKSWLSRHLSRYLIRTEIVRKWDVIFRSKIVMPRPSKDLIELSAPTAAWSCKEREEKRRSKKSFWNAKTRKRKNSGWTSSMSASKRSMLISHFPRRCERSDWNDNRPCRLIEQRPLDVWHQSSQTPVYLTPEHFTPVDFWHRWMFDTGIFDTRIFYTSGFLTPVDVWHRYIWHQDN